MVLLNKYALVLGPQFQGRCGLAEKNCKENNNVIKGLKIDQERLN